MVDAANRIKKGTGQYLFFTYLEEWERINHRRVRVRQVPLNLEITPYIRQGLHDLLLGELKTVRLKEGNLDVVIERRERRQHHLSTSTVRFPGSQVAYRQSDFLRLEAQARAACFRLNGVQTRYLAMRRGIRHPQSLRDCTSHAKLNIRRADYSKFSAALPRYRLGHRSVSPP